ncbi:MAG TPA: hypothetical protein VM432_02440 [Bdellovibrionales bacterium]|jgi:hypothetical protein|nr:hypothetical protein [Bdellovibrionales bacterium]
MKALYLRKLGRGLLALSISQVLLLGCATTSPNTPEEQTQLNKMDQRTQRADARYGGSGE